MDIPATILGVIAFAMMVAVMLVLRRARRLQEALLRERELLETLLNNIPDQIYFKNSESLFIRVNQCVANTLGVKTPDDAIGKTDGDFFRAEDAKAFREDDLKVMSSGTPLKDRVERGTIRGIETWMSTTKAPIFGRGQNSSATGIVGISRDITERVRTQQQLANVVAKARCILWTARVNKTGEFYKWNVQIHSSDIICKEFGISSESNSLWKRLVSPEEMEKMHKTSHAAIEKGAQGYQQEFWIRAENGMLHCMKEDVQIAKVGENEWDFVGVALDITERKRFEERLAAANEKLERIAREDTLTGLLNRRALMELSEMEWARWVRFTSPFSVLILDVDNFKQVNDVYGHDVGDLALKQIAGNLQASVRTVDRLGRYGGEEFVIVLPATTQEGAIIVGKKAAESIRSTPLKVDGHTLNITVSIGSATVHKTDRNACALLTRADQALLKAKRSGKNCVIAATDVPATVH